jgi:hypothetical protein
VEAVDAAEAAGTVFGRALDGPIPGDLPSGPTDGAAARGKSADDPVERAAADGPDAERTPEPASAQQVAELTATVAALARELDRDHARAEARERVIDKLHAEVERLRTGEQSLLLRPLVTDLQKLRNDLLHQASTLPAEFNRQQASGLLESYALSVELTLERCGSIPLRPAVGTAFSAREHHAVRGVPATVAEQDGTVAAVLADGYLDTRTSRVSAPAKVEVWRWTSTDAATGAATRGSDHRGPGETTADV